MGNQLLIARKTQFAIDKGIKYEGYTFNHNWNGWACPYFTKEIALKVCEELLSYKYDDEEERRSFYDEETDIFYCEDFNSNYEREVIGEPFKIITEDGVIDAYYFGGTYRWDEEED